MLERYGEAFTVFSDLSPDGRAERGFIQPLGLTDESCAAPGEAGRGGGRFLLVAGCEAIAPDERVGRIVHGSRRFVLVKREELNGGGLGHIECLLRCVGREDDA